MSWFVKYLGGILLVLMCFTHCYGQEKLEDPRRDRIELRPSLPPEPIDEHSVVERLDQIELPPSRFSQSFVNEVAPPESAPGDIQLRYDGLQGVIVRKILSYYNRAWNDAINERFNKGYISIFDYERLMQEKMDAEGDAQQGRWWERRWDQSLPEEKGGAKSQAQQITIGHELPVLSFTIPSIGEIMLKNTGQIKFGPLFFYVNNATVDARTQSASTVASGLMTSKEVCVSDYVKFSIKPRITINASLTPEKILSNVSVEARFQFYSEYNRKSPWSQLYISVDSSPVQGIACVRAYFEILCW